ncbi:MAG: hypothetical protein A2Z21_04325 [Candidatus Fraserbacteria bacterium RBG_16_55_9]|uniref:SIMPL domain-containing protein n=1 Tax=Fraserbacteria sp. (strain RBG_16_55_9) TaxID=1817864 RepID=A0A1F5UP05_FRAXR|nr:MAG: hypothetical protein A2Z21_04325 [Candidatus Fraserbacteria bacterium RBG_16_55_9]
MLKQATISAGIALAVLAIFLLGDQVLGPAASSALAKKSPDTAFQRTISVMGEGKITAKPDSVQAEIGVTSLRNTLKEAIAENNEKMAAVIAALKGLGIAEKDIQTVRFNVDLERADYNGPITGYRVSNQLHVTIRDLNRAGEILDRVIEAGANDVSGVRFAVSDVGELEKQARLTAIADAMSKAREMVEAVGAKLGSVLTITTASYSPPAYERSLVFMASSDAKSVPLEPGELQLYTSVQVVFAID